MFFVKYKRRAGKDVTAWAHMPYWIVRPACIHMPNCLQASSLHGPVVSSSAEFKNSNTISAGSTCGHMTWASFPYQN